MKKTCMNCDAVNCAVRNNTDYETNRDDCHVIEEERVIEVSCIDCGKTWEITVDEYNHHNPMAFWPLCIDCA